MTPPQLPPNQCSVSGMHESHALGHTEKQSYGGWKKLVKEEAVEVDLKEKDFAGINRWQGEPHSTEQRNSMG